MGGRLSNKAYKLRDKYKELCGERPRRMVPWRRNNERV